MWLLRMRHLCCSLVHDTQSTAKGHRNHWWLTIILFDLFRFPAPPYQTVIPSVIHQKDTIATIRVCQGHFQHIETKMGCLCGLFCHCDKQNRLDVKHFATIFLCPFYYHYYYLICLQLENLKRTSSKRTWGLWHSSYSNSSKTTDILKVFIW